MDSGVFRSTDNGQNWVKTSAGLPAGYATTLFASSAFLFAGTNRGVYCSGNGGDSWKWVSENLVSTAVYSFAVVGTDLYAGTSAYGVWKRPLLEMTSVEPGGTELPLRYGLEQNYPNPFNPNTTIRYGLPQKSRVTLTVFNTLGQQIAQLVNGEEEAGYHELRFDGSTLASGVYFYRIQVRPLDSAIGPASPAGGRDSKSGAGSFVEAKKFILLR
jgi:hypothetical protein